MLAVRGDLRVVCDFGYGKTNKSRRTASTDGGNLLGNTGKPLEKGAVFEVLAAAGNLFLKTRN